MQKNVGSQKLIVFAFDSTTNLPKTGDSANITAYVSKDYGAVTVLGDTSATEMDSTNAKGYYLFDLTQGETNADTLVFSAKSSTSNIVVIGVPATVFTTPPNFSLESIDGNGRGDVIKIAGTTQTARDLGASVLISPGTGTGQLNVTSGVVQADAAKVGGVAQTGADLYAAVANIGVTSAALNKTADSISVTTGTETGTVANTTSLDGTYDAVADAAGTVDFYYEATLPTTGAALTGVNWVGYVAGAVNTVKVYLYNWNSTAWEQVGSVVGIAGTVNGEQDFDATNNHTGTGGNALKVRIRFSATGLTSASVKTDRVLFGYTVVPTYQSGDAFAVVNDASFGNAKLVRSTTPANTLTVDSNHLVAVPDTQKVDVNTVKTNPVVNAGTITFPTNATLASTTNITAGTITTVTNLTNLPAVTANWLTAAGLAADAGAEIAAAVWDLATSGHTGGGTFGAAMNAAGSAGDPWATALPGVYGSGTAGFILGTNLNTTITSRMAGGSSVDVVSFDGSAVVVDGTFGLPVVAVGAAYDQGTGIARGISATGTVNLDRIANIDAVKTKTDQLQFNGTHVKADVIVRKNTALANFAFFLRSTSDGYSGKTGATVTAKRCIDNGVLATCTNAVVEIGSGLYRIDLAAADLDGDVVTLLFTATGAIPTPITLVTQS